MTGSAAIARGWVRTVLTDVRPAIVRWHIPFARRRRRIGGATSLVIDRWDLQPGGRRRYVDHGAEYGFKGVFHDVQAPGRIVQTSGLRPERPGGEPLGHREVIGDEQHGRGVTGRKSPGKSDAVSHDLG
ncbi:SRPBCC domain-containing protein [Actinomadura scrupuli]|uniref:SRPBCC domain-containing protein n=1 Tax=Actinomadura scrupuli TaxID=559629 RepID=UPI003D952609